MPYVEKNVDWQREFTAGYPVISGPIFPVDRKSSSAHISSFRISDQFIHDSSFESVANQKPGIVLDVTLGGFIRAGRVLRIAEVVVNGE